MITINEELIRKKAQEEQGIWLLLDDNLVFLDKDLNYVFLPEEIQPFNYYIYDESRRDTKYYSSLKAILQNIKQKLTQKKIGYFYEVMLYYNASYRDSTRAREIFTVYKTEEGFEIKPSTKVYRTYFDNININNDTVALLMKQDSPNWIEKKVKKNAFTEAEQKLREDYNVRDIIFRHQCAKSKKEIFFTTLLDYYKVLSNIIDIKKLPQVSIVYTRLTTCGAYYSHWRKEIKLKSSQYRSFYHEFFHHLDETTLIRKDKEKVEDLYHSLIQKLLNDVTLMKFKQENAHLLNKDGKVTKSSRHYKESNHYQYWLNDSEILARFFSDFMYFYYNEFLVKENRCHKFNFTSDEVKKYSDLLIEILVKVGLWIEDVKLICEA